MQPFSYSRVTDNAAAVQAGNNAIAKFIAGGTNLMDLIKFGIEQPGQLVDINKLGLKNITALPSGGFMIGALVSNSDIAYHEGIRKAYPLLSEAILSGASPQLRNMATAGGNLLQRTRCPYFYDIVFNCNKRVPGSGCSALTGYNRSNAVLGGSSSCIATHPSDMCVALAALDAVIHIQGTNGDKQVAFTDFHLLPGDTPQRENVLETGDLITAIELQPQPFAKRSHYLKVRDRSSYEFALASAAVMLDVRGGVIQNARVALGGVGTKPWRSKEAEAVLIGAKPTDKVYKAVAEAALAGAQVHEHNAFKIPLAKRTLVRALEITGGMA